MYTVHVIHKGYNIEKKIQNNCTRVSVTVFCTWQATFLFNFLTVSYGSIGCYRSPCIHAFPWQMDSCCLVEQTSNVPVFVLYLLHNSNKFANV